MRLLVRQLPDWRPAFEAVSRYIGAGDTETLRDLSTLEQTILQLEGTPGIRVTPAAACRCALAVQLASENLKDAYYAPDYNADTIWSFIERARAGLEAVRDNCGIPTFQAGGALNLGEDAARRGDFGRAKSLISSSASDLQDALRECEKR